MNRSSSTKSTKAGEDKVTTTTTLLSTSQIPIIDLAHMGTDECPVKHVVNRVATQLSKALQNKGLAILVNHGIPEDKLKEAWKYLDGFCNLPADVKDVYLRKTGFNHGYVKPVAENVGKPKELRHAFNICTVSGASLPEEPMPGFQDLIADLTKDFKNLASLLLQALAVALDVPLDFFLEKHDHMLSGNDENETTLRLLYYPPIVEDDNTCELVQKNMSYSYQRCASHALQLDKIVVDDDDEADGPKEGNGETSENDWMKKHRGVTRCGAAHCDYGTFTLLCQDAEGGLEAKLPGTERWQRVGHLPGSILINAGELLAMWTNDKFPALPHRVVIPEQPAIKLKGRHAMAFFVHPDNDTEIVPIGTQVPVDPKETNGTDLKKKKTIQTRFITAYQHIQRKFKTQTD